METGGIFNGYGRKSERSFEVLSRRTRFSSFEWVLGYLNIERASRGNKVDDESTRWPVASGCINVTRKIPKRNRAETSGIAATRCSAGISNGVVVRMLFIVVARSRDRRRRRRGYETQNARCVNHSSNSARMHFRAFSNINFPSESFNRYLYCPPSISFHVFINGLICPQYLFRYTITGYASRHAISHSSVLCSSCCVFVGNTSHLSDEGISE